MIKINCDLCGKTVDMLNKAIIEGVELNVCSDCSKFGKVVGIVKKQITKETKKQNKQAEKTEALVENYSEIIKKRRESMGLSQKDFALKINEKESLVHKIETGNFSPSIHMARKLEKALGIKLIEEHQEMHELLPKRKEEGFTLGDFINVRK